MEKARPLLLKPSLSLIIPAPGERESASDLAGQAARALGALGKHDYEMIVVGPRDDSLETAARPTAAETHVRYLCSRPTAPAEETGAGLEAAVREASGAVIAVIGDGRVLPPETLAAMLAAAERADLVIASRYVPGGGGDGESLIHHQLLAYGQKLAASALFTRVRASTDPLSDVFLFRRDVIEGVDLRPDADGLLLEVLVRGKWSRLTEVAYRSLDGAATSTSWSAKQELAYLRHLAELRLRGPRGHGGIRYHAIRGAVGPDDPQPLDDDLPEDPEQAGKRRRRLLWLVALMALALRFVLLPLGHAWDLTVDYNVFMDLARNHSPYDTMRYLSHVAQSARWDTNYEYYAYPPVAMYIYYPFAHLFAFLHPKMTYFIPASGTFALPTLPFDFYFLLKLPIWIADFLIAALLARMSGTIRGFRDYLLNPYVLLVSGAWTFDAIMVLGLVLGAYWLQRGRMVQSGLAMAFGTMVKFVPALVAPIFVLYLIKKKRPLREIVLFLAAFGAGCVVLLGPFLNGLLSVLSFHGERVGGGMNWEEWWRLWNLWPDGTRLNPISHALGAFGTPALVIVLLLAYWYAFKSDMRFNRMIIVALLAFFIGSKLVNEQYALVLFPFAFLEARQVGGAWRWLFHLFWIVPLAFAVMHVPIDHFLWLFYHSVFGARADVIALKGLTGFESPFVPWENVKLDQVTVLLLGVAFFVLSVVAMLWPVRPPRRAYQHAVVPVAEMVPEAPQSQAVQPDAGEGDITTKPEVALQL